MSTIDVNKSYVIQGATLQDICNAVKQKISASSINVNDLATEIENMILGIDWVEETGNPNAEEPLLTTWMMEDVRQEIEDDPDWSQIWVRKGPYENVYDFIGTSETLFSKLTNEFAECRLLKRVKLVTLNNLANLNGMFQGCDSLHEIYMPNTSSATHMRSMFSGCRHLIKAPAMDTSNVQSMGYMFAGCNQLRSVPVYDISGWIDDIYSFSSMFAGCKNLNLQSLENILIMCANSPECGYLGNNLSNPNEGLGLNSEQIQKCQRVFPTQYQAALNNGWYV